MSEPIFKVERSPINARTSATCESRGCTWRASPADGQACRVHVEATGHKVVLVNKSTSTYHARS